MASLCTTWNIPFLNLSEVGNPEDLSEMLKKSLPKIILSSIEDISREEIQSQLQLLDIAYVAIDECQVWNQNYIYICDLFVCLFVYIPKSSRSNGKKCLFVLSVLLTG